MVTDEPTFIDDLVKLHFNDYKTYHEIYSVESRFTKDPAFYNCFNANDSTFGAIDPNDAKVRRSIMHPFFSRRAVLQMEDNITKKVRGISLFSYMQSHASIDRPTSS